MRERLLKRGVENGKSPKLFFNGKLRRGTHLHKPRCHVFLLFFFQCRLTLSLYTLSFSSSSSSSLSSLLLLSSLFNGCPTPTHSITTIHLGLSLFLVGENTHKAKIKGVFYFFYFLWPVSKIMFRL